VTWAAPDTDVVRRVEFLRTDREQLARADVAANRLIASQARTQLAAIEESAALEVQPPCVPWIPRTSRSG